MSKKHHYLGILMIILLMIVGLPMQGNSKEMQETKEIIKVGLPRYERLANGEEDVSLKAYTYEYLKEISNYNDWEYEFIEGDIGDLLVQLEKGDIDLLGGIVKNKETEAILDFPEYSSGSTFATLSVRSDNKKYDPGDYTSFDGMQVGVLKTAKQQVSKLEKFCQMNGIKINKVPMTTGAELKKGLEDGVIDAILSGDLILEEEMAIVARFGEMPYYFATTKGKINIVKGLNLAQEKIKQRNQNYDKELYKKYFKEVSFRHIIPSQREEAYMAARSNEENTIKVAVVSDWYPMIYLNKKSETYQGLAIDILSKLSKATGLKFELIPTQNMAESMEQVSTGKVDMVACMIQDFELAQKYKVKITVPYVKVPNTLITKTTTDISDLSKLTIAKMRGSTVLTEKFKKIQEYDNMQECVYAVIRGEVDYTLCNANTAEIVLRQAYSEQLYVTDIQGANVLISFGLNENIDGNIFTLLEKVIYSISEEEYGQSLIRHSIAINNQVTFSDFIYTHPLESIILVILIASFLLIVFFSFMQVRIKYNKQVADASATYRILADIKGEIAFVYDINEDTMFFYGSKSNQIFGKDLIKNFSDKLCKKDVPIALSVQEFRALFTPPFLPDDCSKILRCRTKINEWRWFEALYTIILNKEDKPIRVIGRLSDIDEAYRKKEELIELSQKDSLTGLFNRASAGTEIVAALNRQGNGNRKGVLLIIDIDHFKNCNDTYGHQIGDYILCFLADSMKNLFSDEDILCRWGGDEFIVFINENTSIKELQRKVVSLCSSMKNCKDETNLYAITVSIGGVIAREGDSIEDLFKEADDALYRVKNAGRDGFALIGEEENKKYMEN